PGRKGAIGGGELGVIPGVVELSAEFGVQVLVDGDVLEHAEIPVIDSRLDKLVAPGVSLDVVCVRAVRRSWGQDTDWAPGEHKGVDVVPIRMGPNSGISGPNLVWNGRGERSETLPVLWQIGGLPLTRRKRGDAT